MRAKVRQVIEDREVYDRLDRFTQRVCDWNGCVMPSESPADTIPMQVAEQVEAARRTGDSFLSVPFFGALMARVFG